MNTRISHFIAQRRSLFIAAGVFAAVWMLLAANAILLERYAPQPKAYFPELAEAFLEGRMYLIDPPRTLDLTYFEDRWYVAFPPLGALLMLPEVALEGFAGVNTVAFSILYAALSAALVFLTLDAFSKQGWTQLNTHGNLWITAFFTFSTALWQLTLGGSVTYISQVLTTAFLAGAVFAAVASGSPWLAGSGLALAMLARPNVFLMWPFLLAIWLQREKDRGQAPDLRKIATWTAASAVPVALAVAGLLAYNAARFHNPFDFGYLEMNVLNLVREELAQYGQFNLVFIPRNLHSMLLALPVFDETCGRWAPDPWGMSLLLTGPALVYAFRARGKQPWVLGAWASLVATVLLLLLYYNTGYSQFGYRFSMDFMLPLVCLMALGSRKRVSALMIGLIVFGIAVNLIGMLWYYGRWC
ncbi:MAG: hypothetical protein JW987_01825 [Anaerolineaceae bacterium]|nr:hypothetical protein [Anaerolineaceae bacterium]